MIKSLIGQTSSITFTVRKGPRVLGRTSVYAVILLTIIWIILRETFTVLTVAAGIVISALCVFFCYRYLPLSGTSKFKTLRLMIYPFFLIWEVYVAGISAIKLILTDAHVEIVKIRTGLHSLFLRTILVNSITLVPGSVSLDLKDDVITVLWLKKKNAHPKNAKSADELIKGRMERILLKAQK